MNLYQNSNLLNAFDLYVREQDALLPREGELSSVTLSPAFHEKMQRLLMLRKRGFYVLFGTAGRRVASILVAMLLALTTATVSVKALRESVLHFFAEVFDTHTQVTFVDETPDIDVPVETVFEPRTPTYIPEGYVMEQETEMEVAYSMVFADEVGNKIRYKQRFKDSMEFQTDTEGTQYAEITINEYIGITYSNKGIVSVVFSDDSYTYTLSGAVPSDELVQIAESIVKK